MATPAHRLLLVLPSLERGGAERVMLELAHAFHTAGREVHLATLLAGGPLRAAVPPGVVLHELVPAVPQPSTPALAWQAFRRLVALLHDLHPDAVLSTVTGTNLLATLAIRTVHPRPRLVLREASGLLNASPLKRRAMRWIYPHADAVIAVSHGVAGDLRGLGVPAPCLHAIHNPVDANRLRALAAQGHVLPELQDTPYLVALGRLTPAKDYPTLLQAYARSQARHSHRLVLVGEGPERAALEAQIAALGLTGRALLPGALANPFHVLRHAAALVLSSCWEGCPNVLLEALALGVPVVATDCPHGPAELLDQGRHGRLVPVGAVNALAAAMEDVCTFPVPPSTTAVAGLSPSAVAARYLAVLDGAP